MEDQERPDPQFDAITARLLRREALRRAAEEINTTSGPGLDSVLARISADVTAEAVLRVSARQVAASLQASSARPDLATKYGSSGGSQR